MTLISRVENRDHAHLRGSLIILVGNFFIRSKLIVCLILGQESPQNFLSVATQNNGRQTIQISQGQSGLFPSLSRELAAQPSSDPERPFIPSSTSRRQNPNSFVSPNFGRAPNREFSLPEAQTRGPGIRVIASVVTTASSTAAPTVAPTAAPTAAPTVAPKVSPTTSIVDNFVNQNQAGSQEALRK